MNYKKLFKRFLKENNVIVALYEENEELEERIVELNQNIEIYILTIAELQNELEQLKG